LHRGITSCPRLHPFDPQGLWDRSVIRQGACIARTPSAEDLLVQVGLHAAFQHGLKISTIQYLDLRRLLEGELDFARVVELASAAHAEIALACALEAAEVLVGAVTPEAGRAWQ